MLALAWALVALACFVSMLVALGAGIRLATRLRRLELKYARLFEAYQEATSIRLPPCVVRKKPSTAHGGWSMQGPEAS